METKPHFFVSVITRSVACVNPQRNFWGILWEERQRKGRARSKKSLVSAYRGRNKGFKVGGGERANYKSASKASKRLKTAAVCPRVADFPGEKNPLLSPKMRPHAVTFSTASRAQPGILSESA